MKRTTHKREEKAPGKFEKTFMYAAFAEAGELYSGKRHKEHEKEKGIPHCKDGETSSGLCVGNNN